MQSAQIIKINDDGGLLPKKKINGARRNVEEIVTHTKFYLDEGMRIEEGDHEPREVKEKMKWKMTQWSLVI